MKRLSEEHKARLRRVAFASAKRRLAERTRRRARLLAGARVAIDSAPRRWVKAFRDGVYLPALVIGDPRPVPANLSLIDNYEATATFLQDLHRGITDNWRPAPRSRRRARRGSPPIYRTYWDFTQIERITAPVALMVASEYDRIRKRGGWRPHAIDFENWRPSVRAMLDDIGFLALCGVTEKPEAPILEGAGWRVLRLESGTSADGERVGQLLQRLGLDAISDEPALYEALIEALANTRHHAYPEGLLYREPHYPGWWMTGFLDYQAKSMTIAVYDRGVTIPITLADPTNEWEHYPHWRRLMMRATGRTPTLQDTSADGASIAAAMKVGKSSTGLDFRGRGLKAFEDALSMSGEGVLTIRSRSGEYVRERGSKARYRSHSTPIDGTLITWRVGRSDNVHA